MLRSLTVSEAAKVANVTESTVRNWAKDFKIGFKVGGRWTIHHDGLKQVLLGELHYNYRYKKRGEGSVNKVYGESNG